MILLLCCVSDMIVLSEGTGSWRIKAGQEVVLEESAEQELLLSQITHTRAPRETCKSVEDDGRA